MKWAEIVRKDKVKIDTDEMNTFETITFFVETMQELLPSTTLYSEEEKNIISKFLKDSNSIIKKMEKQESK